MKSHLLSSPTDAEDKFSNEANHEKDMIEKFSTFIYIASFFFLEVQIAHTTKRKYDGRQWE